MTDLLVPLSGQRLPRRSGRGGRPPQELAARLGPHILSVALEQFLENGPERTSMDDIATAAAVSKRTLYARHESKLGLLVACIQWGMEQHMTPIAADIPHGTVRQRLLQVGRTMLDQSLKPEVLALGRLAAWAAARHEEMPGSLSAIRSTKGFDLFHSILVDAPGARNLGKDELRFISAMLFDMLVTSAHIRVIWRELDNTPEAKDAFLERALDMAIAGLPFLAT